MWGYPSMFLNKTRPPKIRHQGSIDCIGGVPTFLRVCGIRCLPLQFQGVLFRFKKKTQVTKRSSATMFQGDTTSTFSTRFYKKLAFLVPSSSPFGVSLILSAWPRKHSTSKIRAIYLTETNNSHEAKFCPSYHKNFHRQSGTWVSFWPFLWIWRKKWLLLINYSQFAMSISAYRRHKEKDDD